MIVTLEVHLPDTPGQLMKVVDVISLRGGNFFGIYHLRDLKTKDMVPVVFEFEIESLEQLNKIKSALEIQHIKITRLESEIGIYEKTIILIGHIYDTDIKDTLDRLMAKKAFIRKVDSRIKSPEQASSLKINFQYEKKEDLEQIYAEVKQICAEKNLNPIFQLEM
ncbi:MAG: hypothetical protein ACXQS8_04545 [Candidatus Helarchaeales archaeon]